MDEVQRDLLKYNRLMQEAQDQFRLKKFDNTIRCYEEALTTQVSNRNLEKQSLIKQNLGIIRFHLCEYKKSLQHFQEAYDLIRTGSSEFRQVLMIKLLGNLSIVNFINNAYDKSKECNAQAIEILEEMQNYINIVRKDEVHRRLLFEELMSIYFRFTSFEAMEDGMYESLEQNYDGITLGCFYSAMGLNRELCDELQKAYNYHRRALFIFQKIQSVGFIVICLRRMLLLSAQLNYPLNEQNKYLQLFQDYMSKEEVRGIGETILFKDCERKLQCAKDITFSLSLFEKENITKQSVRLEKENNPVDLWKRAVKLRICQSIKDSKNEMYNAENDNDADKRKYYREVISQLQSTVASLKQKQSETIERALQGSQFTKEAIRYLHVQVTNMTHLIKKAAFVEFKKKLQGDQQGPYIINPLNSQQHLQFQQLQSIVVNPKQVVVRPEPTIESKQTSQFVQFDRRKRVFLSRVTPAAVNINYLNLCYRSVELGDYITKCNKTTNGRIKRFFRLSKDGTLRWAGKDTYINDSKKAQYYNIQDIRGLIFGKCTDVLQKNYNKQLEPYLCLSLVMKTRTMDLYLEEYQIDTWVIALSDEIKKRNRKSYSLSPGKYFWKKMKLKLWWYLAPVHKNIRANVSFSYLIVQLARNSMRLSYK